MLKKILEQQGVKSLNKGTQKSIKGGFYLGVQTCRTTRDCTQDPGAFCMHGYCFL